MLESNRYSKTYGAEPKSSALNTSNIKITNNKSGTADKIVVSNLSVGDQVKVYSNIYSTTVLGSATVTSGTTATITISQLGESGGTVYLSVTRSGKAESIRVAKSFSKE